MPSLSRFRRAMLPLVLLLPALAATTASATPRNMDAGLFRVYTFDRGFTQANFLECGQLPAVGGCFASGTFGPIGHIGAMMEGVAVVDTVAGTASRKVYVVDQAVGRGTSTRMSLVVYQLDTTFDASDAHTTLTKLQTIPLPLLGGLKAHTFMAANAGFLFIGTDQGGTALRVSKAALAVTPISGFTPSVNVSSITADDYGYVNVTFGALNGADGVHAYAPDGASLGLNRGAAFKLGAGQGLSTGEVLARQSAAPMALVRYGLQSPPRAQASNANPDAGLSTDFAFDPAFRKLTYAVCGSVPGSSGCYATGTVGTFGHVGALVQDVPTVDAASQTVTRNLYVFDQAVGGGSSTTVALYGYQVVETINPPDVSVSVTRNHAVGLALIGGANAKSFIAGNPTHLFVGTDQGAAAAQIAKADWSVFGGGGSTSPPHISAMTTDHYGFAGYTYGGLTGNNGYEFYGPTGYGGGGGGGQGFLLGTVQALSTANVLTQGTP